MATTKNININVDTKKARKNVEGLSDSVNKEASKTAGIFGKLSSKIDSLTGGMVSKFKGLTGSLGGVRTGFKGVGTAIAASGLGLLVLTIGAVVTAFKSSEEGQNKFAKIMGVIGSVVGNVTDLISDFGEMVIDAFENPGKYFEKFKKALKDNVTTRIKGLLNLLPSLGKAIEQVFSGDFSGAAKTATNAVGQVVLGVESVTDSVSNAIEKVKEFGAEIKKDGEIAAAIAAQRAAADKKERDLLVQRAIANRDVADARNKAADRDKYSTQERIKFLKEASAIEDAITLKEIEAAKLRADAKTAENALSKSTKEDLLEEETLKAKVIELETKSLNLKKALTAQISTLNKEQAAADEAEIARLEAIAEKQKEIERKRLEDIQTIRDEFKQKIEDLDAEDEQAKLDLAEERKIAELEALDASLSEMQEVRDYYDKLRTENEEEEAQQRVENALAEKQAKDDITQAAGDVAIQFGQLLQQLGEENRAIAIAGIVTEQVASVAKIISATGVANATAAAALPLTGGMPFTAINSISAGLSIASGVASAAKAIGALGGGGGGLQRDAPSGGSGGGAAQPQAPSFNLVGQGGLNQVAQSLNQQNDRPMKAYVVGKEMTSQQEMDRNIKDTATL
ncbi:MAG TPA: hypothetical protein ENH87_17790 [Pricia antarctica]|uniref:Tail tape measure protein n=2 Tax=root TaxID=1 RepID=A0A831QPZ4_9FLAO|nr:hypothetical protein [Pricia antarctica]